MKNRWLEYLVDEEGYRELSNRDKERRMRDKRTGVIANIVFNLGLLIFLLWSIAQ